MKKSPPHSDLTTFPSLLVGDGSVGKTSIVAAFKSQGFTPVYKQTIGIDFCEKSMALRGDTTVSLRIWDVGGQSVNSKSLPNYLAPSTVVFIAYDMTNAESFSNAVDWLARVRQHAPSAAGHLYLVGNKCDLLRERQVTDSQHTAFIAQNRLAGGFFCSAKTGENLVKSFYKVAGEVTGQPLSPSELEFHDKVLTAHIKLSGRDDDPEGRTEWADQIEEEDRLAMERANAQLGCCRLS